MSDFWNVFGAGWSPYGGHSTNYGPPPPPQPPQPTPAPTPGTNIPIGGGPGNAMQAPSVPGTSISGVNGQGANLDTIRTAMMNASNPMTGAYNNIYNFMKTNLPKMKAGLSTVGQQASDAAAIEGGNPAVAQPVRSGLNPAPTLPQPDVSPRAQAPITIPPFTVHGGPQAAAPPVGQQPYGSPWDPQGAGYAAAQRLAAQTPGPMAAFAQQPSSPFTMIMRPNAPANNGGRGGGGAPLGTALDLSGYRPSPPPAPPAYNLGYGGGGRSPAMTTPPAAAPRAQAAPPPYNPFTHVWRDQHPQPVGTPLNTIGLGGVVQGPHGMELLNPGRALFGGGAAQ